MSLIGSSKKSTTVQNVETTNIGFSEIGGPAVLAEGSVINLTDQGAVGGALAAIGDAVKSALGLGSSAVTDVRYIAETAAREGSNQFREAANLAGDSVSGALGFGGDVVRQLGYTTTDALNAVTSNSSGALSAVSNFGSDVISQQGVTNREALNAVTSAQYDTFSFLDKVLNALTGTQQSYASDLQSFAREQTATTDTRLQDITKLVVYLAAAAVAAPFVVQLFRGGK